MGSIQSIGVLYALSGFCVGALVGMTGVGGGSLMTPLLILFFGIHPVSAVGTDLLYAAATKSAGALVHGRLGTVEWRVVGLLASGSLPMAVLTMLILSRFDLREGAAVEVVTFMLGLALLATALSLIFRTQLVARYRMRGGGMSAARAAILTVGAGAVLGGLVSLTSIGAGALGVVALTLLYPQLPTPRIVGADIVHAVPLTLVAGIGHWLTSTVDAGILVSLLVGSVPGIVLGSYAAAYVSDRALRLALATVLAIVGGKLVL